MTATTVARLRRVLDQPVAPGGRYRILEEIGRGGMGAVYRATDTQLDREVALKVLNLESDAAAERLRQEALVLAKLEHPGIVPVHDVGTLEDGRAFYVMKLVRGRRLDQYRRDPHTAAERLRLFQRLCEPVALAHSCGIVHRDLKPENIMTGEFGEVLVLDWGVAQIAAAPEPGLVAGTRAYMPPEQAAGSLVDSRADVYALGRILRFLFEVEKLPRPVEAICARATAEAPDGRYASAAQLSADIGRYLDGLPVSAYRETILDRAARLGARYKVLIAIVAAYLLMRAAVFFWIRR